MMATSFEIQSMSPFEKNALRLLQNIAIGIWVIAGLVFIIGVAIVGLAITGY